MASNTTEETEYSLRQVKKAESGYQGRTAIELSVLKDRLAGGIEPLSGKIITGTEPNDPGRPLFPEADLQSEKCLRSLVAHPARCDDVFTGTATYSQSGAQFGFVMLWTVVLSYLLMAAIQEASAWIARIIGAGLARNFRLHYPPWLNYHSRFFGFASQSPIPLYKRSS